MSLAFVLMDFQHAGVRRRAYCTRGSADMLQFRAVAAMIIDTEDEGNGLMYIQATDRTR